MKIDHASFVVFAEDCQEGYKSELVPVWGVFRDGGGLAVESRKGSVHSFHTTGHQQLPALQKETSAGAPHMDPTQTPLQIKVYSKELKAVFGSGFVR